MDLVALAWAVRIRQFIWDASPGRFYIERSQRPRETLSRCLYEGGWGMLGESLAIAVSWVPTAV